MAEPLKNYFGPEVPASLAEMILRVYPEFDVERFVALSVDGLEDRELTDRARHVEAALAATLPIDRQHAVEILTESLGPEIAGAELTGMDAFKYLPLTMFVAEYGIEHFEVSMTAQYELTKRFTAEGSIRPFIERYPDRTMNQLAEWATDGNLHVRRLVSEGTRPRLPWAPRLKRFQEDPSPVLTLLETLKGDPEEYVRRSVANNLNDIAKDHPDVVVATAAAWWSDDPDRQRMVRHGLRTLIKNGDTGALAVLGYSRSSPARVTQVGADPLTVTIGEKIRLSAVVTNPSDAPAGALVDFIVHFVKANGSTSPKVFKGAERLVPPHTDTTISKLVSLAQHSTRTHYPGKHIVEVQLNGDAVPGGSFDLER